jgi:hypothetical protein
VRVKPEAENDERGYCRRSKPRRRPSETVPFLEGFDPRAIMPPPFWRHTEAIRYVIGIVATYSAFCPRSRKERDGWVPLRWVDVEPLFGKSGTWNLIRDILLERDVLECDEQYSVGKKAKWYRLGPDWWNHDTYLASLRGRRLLARISSIEAEPECGWWRQPQHEHLDQWLRRVRVDEVAAKPWTCQRKTSRKHHYTAARIAAIQSGESHIIVDSYGRVHSPITNLRRCVRPALRIESQPFVEIDIASCQPLLLGYIVAKVLAGDWTVAQVKRLGVKGPISDVFSDVPMEQSGAGVPRDLLDYVDTCQRAEFYQAMADLWGLPWKTPKQTNELKRLVFKHILFGRVRHGHRRWKAFAKRWPSVARVLAEIKHEDYGASARACQRIESRLMIEGVVGHLQRSHPDVAVQTIHDSVLVVPERETLAKAAVLAEFSRIGLTPAIKSKNYTLAA